MKPVLSVLFIVILVIVAVHRSSSYNTRMIKRYYDSWDGNNGGYNEGDGELGRSMPIHSKGSIKGDPCENKPLWFLKSQARLGKLSPYYDCLTDH